VVTVPALPGCITQGKTISESEANAREAIEGYLESLIKHQRKVPDQRRVRIREIVGEV